MKKYSIILPVRNGGNHVKECVQSILSQTHRDFTLQVLDNCSTDGTAEWINGLNDSRIEFYPSAESLTIEQNWKRILALQKNEFITLIGHDDILHPHYLETMHALIQQHPNASLYQAHFIFIDGKSNLIRPCQPMAAIQYADEFLASEFTQTLDSMGTGYMMRSKDYDAAGGIATDFPKLIFADYTLWVKLILIGYKATSAVTAFSYRLHDSTSKLTNGEDYQEAFGKYVYFLADLRKANEKIAHSLDRYGKQFLLYFCESLSHRLLKTPRSQRNTTVVQYIGKCRQYGALLIPGQSFHPMSKVRIFLAALLDNKSGIYIFTSVKKFTGNGQS
ncbi:MAG: glycosyltransferase [Chitinophagaceae bacterium]